jgi:hypothetical protein
MNNKIIIMVFACMLLAAGAIQIYNTLSFEASHPYPTDDEIYYGGDMSVRSEQYKHVSNAYAAYEADWSEHANVPLWIPFSFLLVFFGFVGYLYYDDLKFEPQKEMFARYGGYHEL